MHNNMTFITKKYMPRDRSSAKKQIFVNRLTIHRKLSNRFTEWDCTHGNFPTAVIRQPLVRCGCQISAEQHFVNQHHGALLHSWNSWSSWRPSANANLRSASSMGGVRLLAGILQQAASPEAGWGRVEAGQECWRRGMEHLSQRLMGNAYKAEG